MSDCASKLRADRRPIPRAAGHDDNQLVGRTRNSPPRGQNLRGTEPSAPGQASENR